MKQNFWAKYRTSHISDLVTVKSTRRLDRQKYSSSSTSSLSMGVLEGFAKFCERLGTAKSSSKARKYPANENLKSLKKV